MSRKKVNAKFRKETRKFNELLLSNMSFKDKIKYVFTGNYIEPLQRTYKRLNRKGQIHE